MNEAGIVLAILLALLIFTVLATLVYGAFFHERGFKSSPLDPIRRAATDIGLSSRTYKQQGLDLLF